MAKNEDMSPAHEDPENILGNGTVTKALTPPKLIDGDYDYSPEEIRAISEDEEYNDRPYFDTSEE